MTDIRKAAHMYILKNGTLCSYLNPRSVLTYLPMGAVCIMLPNIAPACKNTKSGKTLDSHFNHCPCNKKSLSKI